MFSSPNLGLKFSRERPIRRALTKVLPVNAVVKGYMFSGLFSHLFTSKTTFARPQMNVELHGLDFDNYILLQSSKAEIQTEKSPTMAITKLLIIYLWHNWQ